MDWMALISPELAALVAFLAGAGLFLKKLPGLRMDWMIPVILWGLGILFSIVLLRDVAQGIVQGTFVAAAAVFGDQVVKQVTVKRGE